jgi:hypothetical protein
MSVRSWSPGARFGMCGSLSLALSLVVLALTPWGKSTFRDFAEFVRTLRRKPSAG